jgi:hypothetical protein
LGEPGLVGFVTEICPWCKLEVKPEDAYDERKDMHKICHNEVIQEMYQDVSDGWDWYLNR